MRTMIFIAVAIVFSVILVYKRSSQLKEKLPETSQAVQSPAPEYDEYIRILAFNPKEEKNAKNFGSIIEESLEDVLNEYLCKSCLCRVEFVTVGLCLVAVIRIRTVPGKKKRGIEKIWNRQSAETRFP